VTRVLIDECLPRKLKVWLSAAQPGWTVQTVQGAGWASMKNGTLLRAADGNFDVLVTADKNMHHQQNFAALAISVLVFPPNRYKFVQAGVPALVQSLLHIGHGQKAIMDMTEVPDCSLSILERQTEKDGVAYHVFKSTGPFEN